MRDEASAVYDGEINGDHLIICGDGMLAVGVAQELTMRYGEAVTVVLPPASGIPGSLIAALPGVRVLERKELDGAALADAGLPLARGLAILYSDDLGNFHAALRAQEINPRIRLVISIFNSSLGERVRGFFSDCAVLSESSMAAPSFVAAALGEPAPSHVRLGGRTLYVARRRQVQPDHVVCGLAPDAEAAEPTLTGPGEQAAGLVLAVADGTPRDPISRRRHSRWLGLRRQTWRRMARSMGGRTSIAFCCLLAVLVIGFLLLWLATGYSPGNALYLTFLDAAGTAVTSPQLSASEKVAQFMLTFDGMAFLPLVTAAVVGARLASADRGPRRPPGDHVIVVGLGNVGIRVLGQLHDLGVGVVCVDHSDTAAGIPLARRLGLKVVIGNAYRAETLREAGIARARALVCVTNADVVNLETALQARALAEAASIVVRLYDDDLARRVQDTVGNIVSRSVSYLAAPAFAAALLEHQVLRTISVGRHVLLIAEFAVGRDTPLAGRPVDDLHSGADLRVIAIQPRGASRVRWLVTGSDTMCAGDRLVVLGTRTGLSRALRLGGDGPTGDRAAAGSVQ